jgi:hypothetical protein
MSQIPPAGGALPPEPPYVMAQAVPPGPSGPLPPRSTSTTTKVILFVLGGSALMFIACCGACCGFGFWQDQKTHREMAQQLIAEYAEHPLVREHLGGIDRCEPKVWEEFGAFRKHDKVFDVSGPKGEGKLLVDELFGKTVAVYLQVGDNEWELTKKDEEIDAPTKKDR